jgi:hypothetical protein
MFYIAHPRGIVEGTWCSEALTRWPIAVESIGAQNAGSSEETAGRLHY